MPDLPSFLRRLQPERVAVFRTLQLGDMLCAVPALRALRHALPNARLTLIGLPWARDFTRRFAHYVDGFFPFPGFPGLPEQVPDVRAWPAFLRKVQGSRFDLAIQMHGDGSMTDAIVRLLGARSCAGFAPGPTDDPLLLPYPREGSEVRRLLSLAEFLGAEVADERLEFPLDEADDAEWDGYPEVRSLPPGGYLCVHAGARANERRWPVEHFAVVADALAKDSGLPVVLSGSEQELPLTRQLAQAMQVPVVQAAAPVSFGALAALIGRSRLLVSNDTGTSHIAAALRVPSVVVFRASEMERWAPLDQQRHRAVWDPDGTRVDEVLRQARRLLRRPLTL